MNEPEILLFRTAGVVVVCVIIYMFALRRLADLAQPYRLHLAEVGEAMLGEDISEERETLIRFCLDNAFSGWVMVVAAVAFPVSVLVGAYDSIMRRSKQSESRQVMTRDGKIIILFGLSTFVANPLFGTVVAIELFVFGLLAIMLAGPSALVLAICTLLRLETSSTFQRARMFV